MTKQLIIDFLEDKGLLEDVDKSLITELLYNYRLIREAKRQIKKEGFYIVINAGKTKMKNPAFDVYYTSLNKIESISKILGLSPHARKELGLKNEDLNDGF